MSLLCGGGGTGPVGGVQGTHDDCSVAHARVLVVDETSPSVLSVVPQQFCVTQLMVALFAK